LLGGFPNLYVGTTISSLTSITRKGKKLISSYFININYANKKLIWNSEIYLEEIVKLLTEKGFTFQKGFDGVTRGDESVHSWIEYNHKNTKGKLSEIVNECIEIIKETERQTHISLVALSIIKLGGVDVNVEIIHKK